VLSTYLIALREGLEAALIIGILVAYLSKSGKKSLLPFLWLGVGSAVLFSFVLGAFLSFTSTQLSQRGEEIFAGTSSLLAVVFVTWMVFWMKRNARGLRDDLHGKLDTALPMGKIALIFAAFFAVAREGLETALFIYANFKTVSKDTAPAVGLILGLITAIILGYLIYRRTVKINLSKFFNLTGVALIVVAAGVFSHGLNEFQNFGLLPGANAFVWNFHNSTSPLATIFDGTIGIGAKMTWLQLIFWLGYLTLTLNTFLTPKAESKRAQPATAR
jgi:high-affinity iron transporter